MARLSSQTPLREPVEGRKSADNVYTVRRDRKLRSDPGVEEAHAAVVAAWFRARAAVWVYPPDDEVDSVHPKVETKARLLARNMPVETKNTYRVHIVIEASDLLTGEPRREEVTPSTQCALAGEQRLVATVSASAAAAEDDEGRHLRGFQVYAHRDTLRHRRPKLDKDELRRLRADLRVKTKADPEEFARTFTAAEVAERILMPTEEGPPRARLHLPGAEVTTNTDGSFAVGLRRRERFQMSYVVKRDPVDELGTPYRFDLKANRKKPPPDPSWNGRDLTVLERLARCAELWIEPSFVEPDDESDVFDIRDLLDVDMRFAA